MKTMENMNTTMVNEAVEQVAEVISATPKISWKKFGITTMAIGAGCAIGYGVYKFFFKKKDEEQTTEVIDVSEITNRDFQDDESEEE